MAYSLAVQEMSLPDFGDNFYKEIDSGWSAPAEFERIYRPKVLNLLHCLLFFPHDALRDALPVASCSHGAPNSQTAVYKISCSTNT
jgi:hypothetical protein